MMDQSDVSHSLSNIFSQLATVVQNYNESGSTGSRNVDILVQSIQYLQQLKYEMDKVAYSNGHMFTCKVELGDVECNILLNVLKCALEIFPLASEVAMDSLRVLRNGCAINHQFQDLIISNAQFDAILPLLIEKLLLMTKSDAADARPILYSRCALQFLGNLVVNNNPNKSVIWINIRQHLLCLLSQEKDESIRRYSCMLLYNCLKDMPEHKRELLDDQLYQLMGTVLTLAMVEEIEWSLYIIELMLNEDGFLKGLISTLSFSQQYFLLDVIINCLQNVTVLDASVSTTLSLSATNLNFLKELFVAKVDTILNMVFNLDVNSEEPVIVMKLLRILCCASSLPQYQEFLQSDGSLVVTVTCFLKSLHLAGKEGAEHFAPIKEIPIGKMISDCPDKRNPMLGVKNDLIRLIGNLCWKHKDNQDRVREADGIPLLLDCTQVDARNLFSKERVIFAIRSLCYKNLENQALIANSQYLGVAPSEGSSMDVCNGNSQPVVENDRQSNVDCCEQMLEEMNVSEMTEQPTKYESGIEDLFS